MTITITTLSQLLDNAGTQWRVFDMGRRVTKIDKPLFLKFEQGLISYQTPLQNHAHIAIEFWNKKASQTPYIWFLKFPLDEQGKLVLATRDHFASMVLEALGNELSGSDDDAAKLDNNPYVFTPNANRLAYFNALLKVELKQAASIYFEHAELYFSGKLGFENWQSIGIQGIADFACRLHGQSQQHLINALPYLPIEVLSPLCAMLENETISVALTEELLAHINHAIDANDPTRLICLLRAISNSQAIGLVQQAIDYVIEQSPLDLDLLLTLSGRLWVNLIPHLETYFTAVASLDNKDVFVGIFSDLVAINVVRPHLLTLLRKPEKSAQLSKGIGFLFE